MSEPERGGVITPSLWTAYRTRRPSGIARRTWLFVVAKLLCWGVFGLPESDPRLIVLGTTGVVAGVLMLARIRIATQQPLS